VADFIVSKKAFDDLLQIGRYTEREWGKSQRNAYLKQLDKSFYALATMPLIGTSCEEVRKGYRKYAMGNHLVFYRQANVVTIEIVRVLHGSMDVEQHF
jgi:toxin ParE1/3/4